MEFKKKDTKESEIKNTFDTVIEIEENNEREKYI